MESIFDNLREYVTNISWEFIDDYLTTPELQQRFIDQVVDYAEGCCDTEQQVLCFIDGLLINLYETL